uniref:Peptidase S1 domain-containing protein n=1 Tax=Hucho hucho TaxID=62062 RepID=A0A4W5Q5Y6_9TELE
MFVFALLLNIVCCAICFVLCGSSFLLQAYLSDSGSWRTVCSDGWRLVYSNETCPSVNGVTLKCIGNRVVGGQEASLGAWPWQVSLQVDGFHICGGSIITPYWIVKAAHCVVDRSYPEDWTVHAGFGNQISTHFRCGHSSVSHIVTHDYNTETGNNDIALVRLIKPLQINDQIRPVCLPNVRLDFTGDVQCVHLSVPGSGSNSLMEAEVSLIDRTISNSSSVYNGKITQDMKCVKITDPLDTVKDSVWWLVGDTSWGDGCAQRNKPGVYGNVAFFLGWIYEQMQV